MCRADQSLTASADSHYSLKYVSRPPCLVSFSFCHFCSSFDFSPHFLPSHPLYPLSPKLYSSSPTSSCLPLSAISPWKMSSWIWLLPPQDSAHQPRREKEKQLVLNKRKGWMDDRVEGGRLILWKIDMGHRREKMGQRKSGRWREAIDTAEKNRDNRRDLLMWHEA